MLFWWFNRFIVYLCNYKKEKFNEIVLSSLEAFSEKPDIPLVIYHLIMNYTGFYYYKYDSYWPPTPTSDEDEDDDL